MIQENCRHCPLYCENLPCPRRHSNHTAYCDWVNPDHPNYKARGKETLIRIARQHAGLAVGDETIPTGALRPLGPMPPVGDSSLFVRIPLAGDLVEALAKRVGADRLARWWEAKTGAHCNCGSRKEALNNASRALARWAARRPRP